LDEFHENGDWRVGSSDGQSIVEEVELGLVLQNVVIRSARAGLAASEVLVNFQDFLVAQQPKGLSSNYDLRQSFRLSDGDLFIMDVLGGVNNKFHNTFLNINDGDWGDEKSPQWGFVECWILVVLLVP
jgi:hypothetical protein